MTYNNIKSSSIRLCQYLNKLQPIMYTLRELTLHSFIEIITNIPVELFCSPILFQMPLFFNAKRLHVFKGKMYLTVKAILPQ